MASTRSRNVEDKLIAALEREVGNLRKQNARLLRMVELVMEERFYRPHVSGIRENVIEPGLPIDSLNDVNVFDEEADAAQSEQQNASYEKLEHELNEIQSEHRAWRAEKGVASEETVAAG